MAGIRSRNTKPELVVRKLLHRAGFRYRLDSRIGRTRPDIVLPKWNTAIFIHGCFWHGHKPCHLYRLPKSREEFWLTKVSSNRERDTRSIGAIRDEGWNIVTVWECAVKGRRRLQAGELVDRLRVVIGASPDAHEISGVSDIKPEYH